MKFRAFLTLCVVSILFGCAAGGRHDYSTYDAAKEAQDAIVRSDGRAAALDIQTALENSDGAVKIKELFARFPVGQQYYRTYLEQQIVEASTVHSLSLVSDKITAAQKSGILTDDQLRGIAAQLEKKAVQGNQSGVIPFTLLDNLDRFPVLKEPVYRRLIADRTIKQLQSSETTNRRLVKGLVDYVQEVGAKTSEGKRIETFLPSLVLRRNELNQIATVFPAFSSAKKEAMTARIFLQTKGGDRLFTEDVMEGLRIRLKDVEWVTSPGPKTTVLTVERIRHDEKSLPERSETITYAQHQVNIVDAVLLMPRDASYLYDVVSGGSQIEYGYVVTAQSNGKTERDEVIRGKVEGTYNHCQNARIQNVFGGVSSAGFTANDEMKSRCSGSSEVSIESLRTVVLNKVIDSVLQVPSIKVMNDVK